MSTGSFRKFATALFVTVLLTAMVAGCAQKPAAPEQEKPKEEAKEEAKQEAPAQITDIRLMTGPQGGSWYPLGGAMAELIGKKMPNVRVTVQPGAGITNVKAVQAEKAEMGFANSCSTVDAIHGRDPFEKKYDNVMHMMALYPQYFQMVVPADSDIKSVADLKGKVLATQPKGNTGEQMSRHVLEVHGLSYDDCSKVHFVSYSDAVELMKNRQTDAFFLVTTVPASSVMDLAVSRKVRLLSLSEDKIAELNKINSGYVKRVIKAGTYPGQDEDVMGIGTWTHLIVQAKMPKDLVRDICEIFVEGREAFGAVVKAMEGVTTETLASDVGVPFHPGAEEYFKSVKK